MPYWRMVSNARYSVPPGDADTTSRLCSASRASPSATTLSSDPATSAAAAVVNGATNTDTWRSSARSAGFSRAWLQSSAPRTERCRSSAREPPVSIRSGWDRAAVMPSSPSVGYRAAASSIASAIPSSRSQIEAIWSRSGGSSGRPTAAARSMNNATASESPSTASDSGGT